MTKDRLTQFDFRSLEFFLDGRVQVGFLSYDSGSEAFRIIYTGSREGRERREVLPLTDEMIGWMAYNEAEDILTMTPPAPQTAALAGVAAE
jgi:hypothetical protein